MSDDINDAYRPDSKPKGFGWRPVADQISYVKELFRKGNRDEWVIFFMHNYQLKTRDETVALLKEFHPDILVEMGIKDEDVDQGKLF